MKHLLSLADLSQDDFLQLIERARRLGEGAEYSRKWLGRSVGIEFRKTSTRTRTSFAAAAVRLGAHPLVFGPADLQTNTGESIEDTAAVLGGYLDALVVRTAANPAELRAMARVNRIPVINAMTSDEHPTQGLSDLAMLLRHFGRLDGLRAAYLGEGNNTAAALALGASRIPGLQFDFYCPAAYTIPSHTMQRVREQSARYGGKVSVIDDGFAGLTDAAPVDAIYATRWQTTGTSKNDPAWRETFAPYRVSQSLMERLQRRASTIFMHDLPAVRGEDCDTSVLDGPSSIAFEQARQKMFTAMAIFEWCIPDRGV